LLLFPYIVLHGFCETLEGVEEILSKGWSIAGQILLFEEYSLWRLIEKGRDKYPIQLGKYSVIIIENG